MVKGRVKPINQGAASQERLKNAILYYSLVTEETDMNKWLLRKPLRAISKQMFHELMMIAQKDEKLRSIMFKFDPNSDNTKYIYKDQGINLIKDEEEVTENIKKILTEGKCEGYCPEKKVPMKGKEKEKGKENKRMEITPDMIDEDKEER
ncbi:MAG: hypothetical protein GY861_12020 [bacterium]|nr:hypothetical protein [bacterium]